MPRCTLTRALVIVLATWLLSVPPAAGQGSARIAGVVADPTGAVVSGAEITIQEVSTSATRKMMTSTEGGYVFLDLPPGEYTLSAKALGFKTFSQSGITVQVGHAITLNIGMEI